MITDLHHTLQHQPAHSMTSQVWKEITEWGSDGVPGTVACESQRPSCASKVAKAAWALSVRFLAASRNLDMAPTWDSLGTTRRLAKVVLVYLTFPFGTIADDLFGLTQTFSYMNPTVSEQMAPLSQYNANYTKSWVPLSTCQYGRSTCQYVLSTCQYILSTVCPRVVHGPAMFRIFCQSSQVVLFRTQWWFTKAMLYTILMHLINHVPEAGCRIILARND